MSLSVQDIVSAKRRFLNAVEGGPTPDAASRGMSMAFFSWLAQQAFNPDLQVVEFGPLTGTSAVIADAPCKVYAIILKKTTATAACFKGTDHASTGSSTAFNVGLLQNSIKVDDMFFPKGLPMAAGFTVLSNTTMAGNTTSAAGDGASGVVLLGNP
jgi:hypothetical protein